MEKGINRYDGFYDIKGTVADFRGDKSFMGEQRQDNSGVIHFRRNGNGNNKFITTYLKSMAEGKIAWTILTYFGIPMYILALIVHWGTVNGTILIILAIVTGLGRAAKFFFEATKAYEECNDWKVMIKAMLRRKKKSNENKVE